MKKLKPILGISLLVQSVSFLILCLLNLEKKKSLATAFGIFSAIGGVAGTALLVSNYREEKFEDEFFEDDDFFFDEDYEDDFSECDDIECNFAEEIAEETTADSVEA